MQAQRLYFDHHAATPLSPLAREAMLEAMSHHGNPSSVHGEGRARRRSIEQARAHVAHASGARPSSVLFTAGGTEACNLGVLGLATGIERVITTRIEHPAVERAVASLAARGVVVSYVDVRPNGDVSLDVLDTVDASTLVAIQWINHETGHELPIHEIARRVRGRGARLFVDATQAFGKRAVDASALGATALALASHKIGGPAGAGALVIEPGAPLEPLALGGAQEHGLRGGTQDVVALAGFGAASTSIETRIAAMPRVATLRDRIEHVLIELGALPNALRSKRVETVCNVSLPSWRGDWLVAALDAEGIACSSGAACSSGVSTRSPVIAALFPNEPERAGSALRLSLGPETTEDETRAAIDVLRRVIPRAA